MARAKDAAATQFTLQSIIPAPRDWVGVWFDADDQGYDPESVMTEPTVCWAQATWQVGRTKHSGVVGMVAGHPNLYSPELLEDNFRGYCKREQLNDFLEGWDSQHVEDDSDEESSSEEDDSSNGSDDSSEEEEDDD